MNNINSIIYREVWEEFGINKWNDLLMHVFGKVNLRINKYVGKLGLETAIKELKEFKEKNGIMPTSSQKGLYGIQTAARSGRWKNFGIDSWKKLLNYAFREKSH